MPEIIETTVYRLDELSGEAREKARTWYREGGFDHDWFEFVYDDFERICAILGVSLETRKVHLYGGGTRSKPCIKWMVSGKIFTWTLEGVGRGRQRLSVTVDRT